MIEEVPLMQQLAFSPQDTEASSHESPLDEDCDVNRHYGLI